MKSLQPVLFHYLREAAAVSTRAECGSYLKHPKTGAKTFCNAPIPHGNKHSFITPAPIREGGPGSGPSGGSGAKYTRDQVKAVIKAKFPSGAKLKTETYSRNSGPSYYVTDKTGDTIHAGPFVNTDDIVAEHG